MIKAILFDLDDTLLGNNADRFMESYFGLLADYARPLMDAHQFLEHLISSTRAAIRSTDPTTTNADVFWSNFEALTGRRREEFELFFAGFYEREFPRLRQTTRQRPETPALVSDALARQQQVVIATNPLFPRVAIEQRLEWAGVPVDQYDYALVTTFENMHAAKPQPAYYQEIIGLLGLSPAEALMVGDDWNNDIQPAAAVGLRTFWVNNGPPPAPAPYQPTAQGTLADLHNLIRSGWLEMAAA